MARRPIKNYKCYTLSVLAASLTVSAAVSVALALASPPHIHFSITSFTRNASRHGGGWLRLGFTLAVDNTSPSTSVLYRSINVLVWNSDSRSEGSAWIGTDVTPLLPRQERTSSERIDAAVELEGAGSPWVTLGVMPSLETFVGDSIWVNVSALVRYKKPGLPWASLHDINVSCGPIDSFDSFQANQRSPVECG